MHEMKKDSYKVLMGKPKRKRYLGRTVVKGKKLSPCLTNYKLRHEVWGSGCIDPHCLDLGTSWR
jgi:hypothetical protein